MPDESFTACFQRLLRESGLSQKDVACGSWLPVPFVARLASRPVGDPATEGPEHDPKHPTRDAVVRLALGMKLPIDKADELLIAAGYAPLAHKK
jgi:hypothetical protein